MNLIETLVRLPWPELFAGVLLALVFQYAWPTIRYLAARLKTDGPEGLWYVYHITKDTDGKRMLHQDEIGVSKAFAGGYNASLLKPGFDGEWAKGVLSVERNHMVLRLKGQKHTEEFTIRVKILIPWTTGHTLGLWLGIDFHGDIISAPIVFSREPMDFTVAERELLGSVEVGLAILSVR